MHQVAIYAVGVAIGVLGVMCISIYSYLYEPLTIPELVSRRERFLNEAMCTICKTEEKLKFKIVACGHRFHEKCLKKFLKDKEKEERKCPNCTEPI